ncbi:MAG: 50S ribosomal protein L21e [Euryarchaeota archaeon]|nr:50S ribosomal protein L21e [Euryarchaeota archaeon]|tara:strand:- start:68 stop:361 length:294 start_codon:yes stop_codon:yes gene_type:complete
MVTRTKGSRQGTRSILKKGKRERRRLFIGRAMHSYNEGDKVAIVLDGAQQKGMPHRRFQGRTGVIESSQGRAYVVKVADGNKMKTVVSRPEHLRPIE